MMRRTLATISVVLFVGCASSEAAPEPQTPQAQAELVPDASSAEDRLIAWGLREGKLAMEEEQWKKASDLFTGILDRRPNHPWATHYLGVTQEHLGSPDRAISTYRRALRISPELADTAVNLSALLLENANVEEATQVLRETLRLAPSDPRLHANLGAALAKTNDKGAAAAEYQLALKLAHDPRLRLKLGSLLADLGQTQSAIQVYQELMDSERSDAPLLVSVAQHFEKAGALSKCVAALDKALRLGKSSALTVQRGICRRATEDKQGAGEGNAKASPSILGIPRR